MAQKDRSVRRIDERIDGLITGGGQLIQQGEINIAPPNVPTAPEPEDVTIGSQTLLRTTLVPKVSVQVTWTAPVNLLPELYIVDYAEDVDFTSKLLSVSTTLTRAALEMKTNTQYWVRVRAVVRGIYSDYAYPSNYPTAALTTMDDTTAPDDVTSVSSNWVTGDFELSWTNPTSSNFFDTRVRIYDTNGGTLYKEVYVPGSPGGTSRWAFTASDNKQVTGNSPLTTLYYTLYARSIAHVFSPTGVAASVTKSVPSKPTGLADTWSADDGTYKEDLKISWTGVVGASEYLITLDGTQKIVYAPFYEYPYGSNVAEHRPTLTSGDPAIAYTIQARDTLGLTSPGASGTATNIAPQSSNSALTVAAGFSSLYAYVTHTKDIQDFHHYRWLLTSGNGAATIQNVVSFTPEITFGTLNGTYALSLYVYDRFGQVSNPVTTTGIILDGLTIEQLRAETSYTSSDPSDTQVFLNKLKDNIFTGQTGSRYVGNASWRWILAQRSLIDRYRTVTLGQGVFAVSGPIAYLGISTDNVTYRWFSGPLVATGTTGQSTTLTEYATEALAKTNAFTVASMPGNRVDFPSVMEARYIYLGHTGLSSTSDYNFQEFYPRRLIQTDDLEAETIKGINIAASTITADRMSVTQLSAITANIGGLVIDTTGYLWQGTGSAASPTTGLKIYNSGGIGKLSTYNASVEQVTLDTDGFLKAGTGNIVLSSGGISIAADTTAQYNNRRAYRFINGSTELGGLFTFDYSAGNNTTMALILNPIASRDTFLYLNLEAVSGKTAELNITAAYNSSSEPNSANIKIKRSGSLNSITIGGSGALTDVSIPKGLNVGTESGASTGQIRTSASIYSGASGIQSDGSSAGFTFNDRTGSSVWLWYGTGDITRLYNGTRDTLQISSDGSTSVVLTDAATSSAVSAFTVWHRSTGTPAAGFGSNLVVNLHSSTNTDRNASLTQTVWATATDASRKARIFHYIYDTTAREYIRGEASGSAAMIGFLGAAAVVRQNITGVRTGTLAQLQTVMANLLTGLANLGLITDSTT